MTSSTNRPDKIGSWSMTEKAYRLLDIGRDAPPFQQELPYRRNLPTKLSEYRLNDQPRHQRCDIPRKAMPVFLREMKLAMENRSYPTDENKAVEPTGALADCLAYAQIEKGFSPVLSTGKDVQPKV